MAMSRPMRAEMPVSTTTDRLVKAVLTRPGTPTLRMSANSSQRGAIPRNVSRTSARPECRYQTNHAPPTANGSTKHQAGEDCAERKREQEGVEDERVGAFGLSGAEGARDRRRDAGAHPAVGRL